MILQEVLKTHAPREQPDRYGAALFCTVQAFINAGQLETARSILLREERAGADRFDQNSMFAVWTHMVRALMDLWTGDLGSSLTHSRTARELADRAGPGVGRGMADMCYVTALAQTGHVERFDAACREVLASCALLDLSVVVDWTMFAQAWVKIAAADPGDAIPPLGALLCRRVLTVVARATLAQALLARGDLEKAERFTAVVIDERLPPWMRAIFSASRALVELRLQRPQNALELVEKGLMAASLAGYPLTISTLRLTRAEAFHALARQVEARAAIGEARDGIRRVAGTLKDAALSAAFLGRIDAHVRTMELAREWLAEPAL